MVILYKHKGIVILYKHKGMVILVLRKGKGNCSFCSISKVSEFFNYPDIYLLDTVYI